MNKQNDMLDALARVQRYIADHPEVTLDELDQLTPEQLAELYPHVTRDQLLAFGAAADSPVKAAGKQFLAGLDTNDRERGKLLLLALFDHYVTELPGPNSFVKGKIRPSVETAIENLIADWCSED